ncbi:MAG: acyl carrier protein [Gemmatimonadaceae bacterium]
MSERHGDDAIWTDVLRTMRECFDDDELEVTRSTTARDVDGWDSLSNVELMVALESAFRIRFYTGEIANLKNVGELVDVISARLRGERR